MPTTLARLVVSVADLDRALEFYHDLLGFAGALGPDFAILDAGPGLEVMLHQRPSQPSDRAVAASFRVTNLDEYVASWAASGGEVVDRPAEQAWGERMAVVRDADGHLVCLLQDHPVEGPDDRLGDHQA